jgi:hypothetical protein
MPQSLFVFIGVCEFLGGVGLSLMNSCEGLVAPRLVAARARADNVLLVKPVEPLLRAGGILIAAKPDLDLGADPGSVLYARGWLWTWLL